MRLENLAQFSQDPHVLSHANTVDGSWSYHYDSKMKHELEVRLHCGKSKMKNVCH